MKEMSWRHIISKTFLPCQYLPFCSVQNVEDFSRKINYFLVILLCCFTPRETRNFVQVSKLFHTLQNASLPVVYPFVETYCGSAPHHRLFNLWRPVCFCIFAHYILLIALLH